MALAKCVAEAWRRGVMLQETGKAAQARGGSGAGTLARQAPEEQGGVANFRIGREVAAQPVGLRPSASSKIYEGKSELRPRDCSLPKGAVRRMSAATLAAATPPTGGLRWPQLFLLWCGLRENQGARCRGRKPQRWERATAGAAQRRKRRETCAEAFSARTGYIQLRVVARTRQNSAEPSCSGRVDSHGGNTWPR